MRSGYSQSTKLDSLQKIIFNQPSDTTIISTNKLIAEYYYRKSPDSCKKYLELAFKQLKNIDSLKNSSYQKFYSNKQIELLTNMGLIESHIGNNSIAIARFKKAIELQKKSGNSKLLYSIYNNIGFHFNSIGDIKNAIEYFEKSLSVVNDSMRKTDRARSLTNLANLYLNLGENEKAYQFVIEAININVNPTNKKVKGSSISTLGRILFFKKDYYAALPCFKEAFKIFQELDSKMDQANTLNSMAVVYSKMKNNELALTYLNKTVQIQKEANDFNGMSISLSNLSQMFYVQKNYPKALKYAKESYDLALLSSRPDAIMGASNKLYFIYKKMGDYKNALTYYELDIKMRDSLNNESVRKASIKSQLKYEYEKQAAADSVAHAKESEVKNAELAKQSAEIKAKKNQQYALFGGLGLVMIFAGFMYNRFKLTQKQKAIIEIQKEIVEEQKKLVEEKQKEILDSIHYARRIQMAQIPSNTSIEKLLRKLKGIS
ncbi:MAG: tetratricopeptide repeat protein [Sphingobacteriaceae bacterium]|nr:tetratricopeptide repeat protein [Sphingobacteriaceae bacterium]